MKKLIAVLVAASFILTGSFDLAAAATRRPTPPRPRERIMPPEGRFPPPPPFPDWRYRPDWGRRPQPRRYSRSRSFPWETLLWGIPIAIILAGAISSSAKEPERVEEPAPTPPPRTLPPLSTSTSGSTETMIEMMEQELQRELEKTPVNKVKVAEIYSKIRKERAKLEDAKFYEFLDSLK